MSAAQDSVSLAADAGQAPAFSWRFALIAVAVLLGVFSGYWFFIRTSYEPILSDVAPQDAADIVKVLEAKKISYQLGDGGTTVRVASDQADKARIELVGSELPMRGQVGFELFNQSDMGLTDFAQKINYQRALQGELARTILLLEGIQSVRVHLALPDHSLFRDEQSQPKASVTLILKPGKDLTGGAVSGIQRLVAGSITDMKPDAVAVLDGTGRVISHDDAVPSDPVTSSDAIVLNYRRRIREVILAGHPDLQFDVNVSLRFLSAQQQGAPATAPTPVESAAATDGSPAPTPRGDPDYALAVRVTTKTSLDDSFRNDLARMVEREIGFAAGRGDSIVFLVGPLVGEQGRTLIATAPDAIVAKATRAPPEITDTSWLGYWPWLAPIALLLLGAAFWSDRRRARERRNDQLAVFTEQLRDYLASGRSGK